MVSTDGETVAVTGDDPYREGRVGGLGPGRKCGCPPMDGVESVCVHVIGEATRATDARNEDDVLSGDPEFRHHPLDVRKNRVIPAARAPAHILVGDEVFPVESGSGFGGQSMLPCG